MDNGSTRARRGSRGRERRVSSTARNGAQTARYERSAAVLPAVHRLTAVTTILSISIKTAHGRFAGTVDRVKFTCSTKDIASAVGAASKVVNAHTTVPILSNVLLTRGRGRDPRARDRSRADARAVVPGGDRRRRAPSPCRPSCSAATSATCRRALLELTGTPTRASVKAERSNYDFHALPADEYPPLPSAQKGAVVRDRREAVPRRRRCDDLRGVERRGARRRADGHAARARRRRDHDGRDRRIPAREAGPRRSSAAIEGTAKYIVPSRALAEAARNLGAARAGRGHRARCAERISCSSPPARRRSSCGSSTDSTRTTGK